MSYIPCIPTMSLGFNSAGYTMAEKLAAAAAAGFTAIEVFYMDLEHMAKRGTDVATRDNLKKAATEVKELATKYGLTIVVLQPILNYDGIRDSADHGARVEEISFRMELCNCLGTDMMQIPANFRLDAGITGNQADIVRDLQEIADIGARHAPPIRFVYEAMCWSTFNYTWQQGWEVVKAVDRPNFGVVLDAFHIAAYEYADPTVEGGVREDGEQRLARSLSELVTSIPANKIFYVQLVDAERLSIPLGSGSSSPYHVEGQQPYMSWSRNCRLFPYETDKGAYMPIERVAKAFVDMGFTGFISFELFNRFCHVSNDNIPEKHAKRGWQSWLTLRKALQL